jgi:hypothetical protein
MNQVMALTEDQKIVHDKLLTHLLRVRDELMLVDPRSLSLDEHIQWNEEMYQTGLAISKVNGAILTSISSDYASQLPVLESAVKQLTDDLYSLKKANEVIAAISSVLGVITTIVSLLG